MKHPSLQRFRSGVVLHNLLERLYDLVLRLRVRVSNLRRGREQIAIEAPTPQLIDSFRTFSKWASIIAFLVGYHVLLGWIFEIRILKSPLQIFSTMKVNEALCSLFCGSALFMLQLRRGVLTPKMQVAVRVCAGIAALLAFLTLLEYLTGVPFGIDQWVFPAGPLRAGMQPPGRM